MTKNNLVALAGILILLSSIISANTDAHINGIFERVIRRILFTRTISGKLLKIPLNIGQKRSSDEMNVPSTILSNLLWEIEEKIVENAILKENNHLIEKNINFLKILQKNKFLAKDDKLMKELEKEGALAKISADESVKLLNLFLSFAIRLGYHLGLEMLNGDRYENEKIKLENFVEAYKCVEKKFPKSKNSVSILPISISEANDSALIKFNQQQNEKSANYKIYNFKLILSLHNWKKDHPLKYWFKLLKWMLAGKNKNDIDGYFNEQYDGVKKPLHSLMIGWTGKKSFEKATAWSEGNFDEYEHCALFNFGANLAKRIGENFPKNAAEMELLEGTMIKKYEKNWPKLKDNQIKFWEEIEAGMHYEDAIFIEGMQNANTGEELNGIFERVLRQILTTRVSKTSNSKWEWLKNSKPSDEMNVPSTILSNFLWEIEGKIVEKTILEKKSLLNGKVDFFEILIENKFLAKDEMKELEKEGALAKISADESVKLLNLFLSFAIRLGYHLGLKKLNEHRLEREVIKLEKFVKAYNWVENKFPKSKNSVSILPISILNDNNSVNKKFEQKNGLGTSIIKDIPEASACITFNQRQKTRSANYKRYNFKTIQWLLDCKEHYLELEYWVKELQKMSHICMENEKKYVINKEGKSKSPLDRLMITLTGMTKNEIYINGGEPNRFNYYNLQDYRALFNFGVNMAEKIEENFPGKTAELRPVVDIMTKGFMNYWQLLGSDNDKKCWEEIEGGMHYEDTIFIHGMKNGESSSQV